MVIAVSSFLTRKLGEPKMRKRVYFIGFSALWSLFLFSLSKFWGCLLLNIILKLSRFSAGPNTKPKQNKREGKVIYYRIDPRTWPFNLICFFF